MSSNTTEKRRSRCRTGTGASGFEELDLAGMSQLCPRFDDGAALWQAIREHQLEGVSRKRLDEPYRPGERSWIKKENPGCPRFEAEREAERGRSHTSLGGQSPLLAADRERTDSGPPVVKNGNANGGIDKRSLIVLIAVLVAVAGDFVGGEPRLLKRQSVRVGALDPHLAAGVSVGRRASGRFEEPNEGGFDVRREENGRIEGAGIDGE
jgi:hypothetical protein